MQQSVTGTQGARTCAATFRTVSDTGHIRLVVHIGSTIGITDSIRVLAVRLAPCVVLRRL